MRAAAYLRSLDPRLPRSVWTLQAGALANSFGNGIAYPFLVIYLHNVRGFSLATAGLVLAANSAASLAFGPLAGTVIDRFGARVTLAISLVLLALGFGSFPFVHEPWQAFLASAVAGIGNGGFWPSNSTLVAGLTPEARRHTAFALQRVTFNLGIGLGGVTGGLIATTSNPSTFTLLFAVDAATFFVFVATLALVPEPARASEDADATPGRYREVLADWAFVRVAALNVVFVAAGYAQIELLPAFAKNHAEVTEKGIGLVYLVNTASIVLLQLPVAKLLEGRSRMRAYAGLGLLWALAWLVVLWAGEAFAAASAVAVLALGALVFAVGECIHGAVQAPLVADLAPARLRGRYMALSATSWSVGFTLGPALGGFALDASPFVLWPAAAAACLAAGAASLALEPRIPTRARASPAGSS